MSWSTTDLKGIPKEAEFVPIEHSFSNALPPLQNSKKQIRLFRYTSDFPSAVTKQAGDRSPPRFLLEEFDLDRSPDYSALSYEWGSEASIRVIPIEFRGSGGIRTKHIRGNLQRFLAHLLFARTYHDLPNCLDAPPRKSSKLWPYGVEDQWFWADQICINQTNLDERNDQVTMMSDIFSNATRVIAWLGDDAAVGSRLSYLPDPKYKLDFEIIRCSFWTRLWCQQEVSLAKALVLAAAEYTQELDSVRSNRLIVRKLDSPGVPRCLHIWSQGTETTASTLTLEDAIRFFSAKECANPRDRVFGVLGMVRPEERIVVDYQKSVEQVYYTAFLRSFETLLGQDHPLLQKRQQAGSGQISIFSSTFELLAQHMGLSTTQVALMKSIVAAYRAKSEQLPTLLQQARTMINENVGLRAVFRKEQLREYFDEGPKRSGKKLESVESLDEEDEDEYNDPGASYLAVMAKLGIPMPIPQMDHRDD